MLFILVITLTEQYLQVYSDDAWGRVQKFRYHLWCTLTGNNNRKHHALHYISDTFYARYNNSFYIISEDLISAGNWPGTWTMVSV